MYVDRPGRTVRRSSTYPQYRLHPPLQSSRVLLDTPILAGHTAVLEWTTPKIDYLSSRNRYINMLKYNFIFIGETKAILVSEISGSKKRWGNRNSSTAYLHTSYCLSLRPLRGTGNQQFTVIINHRNHTTRVL